MMMARKELPVLTCDRCGHVETIDVPHKEHPWGKITAGQVNGPLNAVLNGRDLCPKCIDQLMAWWKGGMGHVNEG
jgi:hypothetical protein